jgi:FSR family fosmidomycin resistance protein-like MFS transporter
MVPILEKFKFSSITNVMTFGLFVMLFTHTLTHAFQGMHTTIFPVLMKEFNLGYYELGLIAAIPPLCQAVFSIPAGMLSDRFGTKKMIIFSQILSCIGSLVAGFTQNPWMFIVAVSLLYLNTTFYHPPSYSYVTKEFKPGDRSKALGIHGAGGTLGMAIGPISIGFLMAWFAFGWRQVYLAWFIPLLIGLALVMFIKTDPDASAKPKEKTEEKKPEEVKSIMSPSMFWFLVYQGTRAMGLSVSGAFLSIYLVNSGWLIEQAALIIGASSLMGIAAAPIGGFFADKVGEKKWTLYTITLSTICYAVAFWVPGMIGFSALYLGYGFFNLLGMASNSALTAKLSPSKQRGLGFALYFLPGSIMGAIAPMIAAWIANSYGLFPVFIVASGIFFVSLPILQFGVKIK